MIIVHAHGSASQSLNDAVGDIQWYIKEKFNMEYIKERQSEPDGMSCPQSLYSASGTLMTSSQIRVCRFFRGDTEQPARHFLSISTIERKYSKALINEKILEMAGVIENNDSGKNYRDRGIQFKVEGDIRVFSDMITLNYRVYDTADNSLVYIGSRDIGSSGGLRPAAWSISNSIEDALNNRLGILKITTNPAGADIFISGKHEGKGPARISAQKGTQSLEVKMDGYVPYKLTLKLNEGCH
jgi:hypothetical protein